MSRTTAIKMMKTVSRKRWGDSAVIPPVGWGWVYHCEGEKINSVLRCKYQDDITFGDVYRDAPSVSAVAELAELVGLLPSATPEDASQRNGRLIHVAVYKIKELNKLFDGLITELSLPEQTPETLLQWVTRELKARNDCYSAGINELTETRAMYEKASVAHKDLRERFGSMMGVTGPTNDAMVEWAYDKASTPAVTEKPVTAPNKYHRTLGSETVDVYDVLKAFDVKCPALQHLIKKAMCVGIRGHKDETTDLNDILDSAKRAVQLGSK